MNTTLKTSLKNLQWFAKTYDFGKKYNSLMEDIIKDFKCCVAKNYAFDKVEKIIVGFYEDEELVEDGVCSYCGSKRIEQHEDDSASTGVCEFITFSVCLDCDEWWPCEK